MVSSRSRTLRLSMRSSPVRKVDDSLADPDELAELEEGDFEGALPPRVVPDSSRASFRPRREKRFFSLNGVGDRVGSRFGPARRARRLAASMLLGGARSY
jgi:hypothetical protein